MPPAVAILAIYLMGIIASTQHQSNSTESRGRVGVVFSVGRRRANDIIDHDPDEVVKDTNPIVNVVKVFRMQVTSQNPIKSDISKGYRIPGGVAPIDERKR